MNKKKKDLFELLCVIIAGYMSAAVILRYFGYIDLSLDFVLLPIWGPLVFMFFRMLCEGIYSLVKEMIKD